MSLPQELTRKGIFSHAGGYSDASYVFRRLSVLNVNPRETTFFSNFSNGQPAKVGKKALGGPDEVLEPLKGIVRPYLSI